MTRHGKTMQTGEQLYAAPSVGIVGVANATRKGAIAPMSTGTVPEGRVFKKIRCNSLNRISGKAPASRRPSGKSGFVSGGMPPSTPAASLENQIGHCAAHDGLTLPKSAETSNVSDENPCGFLHACAAFPGERPEAFFTRRCHKKSHLP